MDEASTSSEAIQPADIPNRLFFRMGEVARMVAVEPHVLRYWETEFPALAPRKSSSGQRMFRRKDVELLLEIKRLLYDRKYTIEGARQALQDHKAVVKAVPIPTRQESLFVTPVNSMPMIRNELEEILKLLT